MPVLQISGYAGLGSNVPPAAFSEIAGAGYARQPVVLVPVDGDVMSNQGGMTFGPDVAAPWGAITTIGLFDAPSGGNVLLEWPLSLPAQAAASGTVTFGSGAILLHLERLQLAAADVVPTALPAGTDVGTAGSMGGPPVTNGVALLVAAGLLRAAAPVTGSLQPANDLSDVDSPTIARANINQGDVALTFASAILTDASAGNVFHVVMTGNATLSTPRNLRAGATYLWRITQDGVGGRSLGFDGGYKFPAGVPPVLTPAAGAIDILAGVTDGISVYAALTKDLR
jgi:hypothetical protein